MRWTVTAAPFSEERGRFGDNVGPQRKLRQSFKVEKPSDIKITGKTRSTTATDLLTYALFCLLLKDHKSTLTGSLQPKPSPNVSGKGQDAPIEDDDDFEPPRSVAELLQQHQAIQERVRELVRKAERTQLTRAEREFVLCNIRDEDEPNLPEFFFPELPPTSEPRATHQRVRRNRTSSCGYAERPQQGQNRAYTGRKARERRIPARPRTLYWRANLFQTKAQLNRPNKPGRHRLPRSPRYHRLSLHAHYRNPCARAAR